LEVTNPLVNIKEMLEEILRTWEGLHPKRRILLLTLLGLVRMCLNALFLFGRCAMIPYTLWQSQDEIEQVIKPQRVSTLILGFGFLFIEGMSVWWGLKMMLSLCKRFVKQN
jgi:hypothetical protein